MSVITHPCIPALMVPALTLLGATIVHASWNSEQGSKDLTMHSNFRHEQAASSEVGHRYPLPPIVFL